MDEALAGENSFYGRGCGRDGGCGCGCAPGSLETLNRDGRRVRGYQSTACRSGKNGAQAS